MLFNLMILTYAKFKAIRPRPGSKIILEVPYGKEPADVCALYGYQPARGNKNNLPRLASLLRKYGASEAYIASFATYPRGALITRRGSVRPYNIYRDTAEYTICSQRRTSRIYTPNNIGMHGLRQNDNELLSVESINESDTNDEASTHLNISSDVASNHDSNVD